MAMNPYMNRAEYEIEMMRKKYEYEQQVRAQQRLQMMNGYNGYAEQNAFSTALLPQPAAKQETEAKKLLLLLED